jgi:hypothetical protein
VVVAGRLILEGTEFDRGAEAFLAGRDPPAAFADIFGILHKLVVFFRVGFVQAVTGQFAQMLVVVFAWGMGRWHNRFS